MGTQLPLPKGAQPPNFCRGQTAGWIKMTHDTEVGLDPGGIVLEGTQLPRLKKGAQHPPFSAHVWCGQAARWINMPLGT